jgi:probable F420-dependent oxidoreductase
MTQLPVAVIPPVHSGVTSDPDWIAAYAQHAEQVGMQGIVMIDHPIVIVGHDDRYPYSQDGSWVMDTHALIPDALDVLAFLAGVTTTLGLSTGVLVLPVHHPAVLAKRLATIDRMSRGRLRVAVGMGWMHEEIEACGVDFASRGRRADESIDVMRALWTDDSPQGLNVDGEFFSFNRAVSRPQPVARSGVPIIIGGHSVAAARRAGRRGDGFQPIGVTGEELAGLLEVMRDSARAAGRDPDLLEVSLGTGLRSIDPDRMDALAVAGANRVVASAGGAVNDLQEALDELSAAADRLGLAAPAGR